MPPPYDSLEDAGDAVKKDSIYADSAPVEYASDKKHPPNKYQASKKQAGKLFTCVKNVLQRKSCNLPLEYPSLYRSQKNFYFS